MSWRTRAGFGQAGEWMHYLGATWLAYSVGGVRAVALYLIAATLPAALLPRFAAGSLVAPAALAMMAASSAGATVASITILGLLAGCGAGFAGRPPAWLAGIYGTPGIPGILGALVAAVLISKGAIAATLGIGAGLLLAALLAGEAYDSRTPRAPILIPATVSMAFVAGLRVLEPGLLGRPESAGLLVAAWALGVETARRTGHRLDARLVLGMPFVVAAALAWMGTNTAGPAVVFLYGAVAFGVGVVASAGAKAQRRPWPAPWFGYLATAAAGALWVVRSAGRFDAVAYTAGGVCLVGGFASSWLARRTAVRQPQTVATQEPAIDALAGVAPAAFSDTELQPAIDALAEAIGRARTIRRDAIAAFKDAAAPPDPAASAREGIEAAVDELLEDIRDAAERLIKMKSWAVALSDSGSITR